MTVQEKFEQYLADHLNLTDKDIGKIKIHIELREKLEEKLQFKGADDETYSFLTGSYVRNTAIRPPKDVDFFIVLNEKKYNDLSPSDLLNLLEDKIKEIFPDKTIFQQTHSVTIEYDDEFSIDVIPAFEKNTEIYKIPHIADNDESWLESNPKIHKEMLSEANDKSDGLLVPIIKILKAWKREKCNFVKSFHLELLLVEILNNSEIADYAEGINTFFNNAEDYLSEPCIQDPANDNNLVDDYLTESEREDFKDLIIKEKGISNLALELNDDDITEEAINEWGKIFNFSESCEKHIIEPQTTLSLGNSSHKQELSKVGINDDGSYPNQVSIKAGLYWGRSDTKIMNRRLKKFLKSGEELPPFHWLKYEAKTDAPLPYEIWWQVVNTGKHAESFGQQALRGQILRGNFQEDYIQWERSLYTGMHWIECFVIKNKINGKRCIARSGRFYVGFRNPDFVI